MAKANNGNTYFAGGLYTKYPCLNMVWAVNGPSCFKRRYEYLRALLSSLDIGGAQADGILKSIPKELRLPESEELLVTGKKPCDILFDLCTELGIPFNGKGELDYSYIPCLHCGNNCGSRVVSQRSEKYKDETILLAFFLNNSVGLSKPFLKRLSRKTNMKTFLSLFSYRSYYTLRGEGTEDSDVISYPIIRNIFSRFLDIAGAHGEKPEEVYIGTAQPIMSAASVLHQILSDSHAFTEFLDGHHAEFADRYEPLIKNTLFKVISSLVGREVTAGDFQNAVERLSGGRKNKKGILSEFPFNEPGYDTVLPAELMSVFSDFGFEKGKAPGTGKTENPKKPDAVRQEDGAGKENIGAEIPGIDEIRRRNKDAMKDVLSQVGAVPAAQAPSVNESVGPAEQAADGCEQDDGPEMPESYMELFDTPGPEETGGTGEAAASPAEGAQPSLGNDSTTDGDDADGDARKPSSADEPETFFDEEGYLLLPDPGKGEFEIYAPHMSDSWFMEQCRYDSFAMELSKTSGTPGILFYGFRPDVNGGSEKEGKPFFISLDDIGRAIVGTGYHSLLFDVAHKTYYTYNKAFFVDFLLKSWAFQPQTLIASIRSIQVVQSLFFEDSRLYNAELFALEPGNGVSRVIGFLKSYRRLYLEYENRIYEKHKSGHLLLRRSEAFEYAIGTSINISDVATVEEQNCHRLTWITAEYKYSNFRKLKIRGVKIGFQIIPDGENRIPDNALYYATVQCIGRCLLSQVIGKAHPVLLSYGCGNVEFFLPSFGDLSDSRIQSRLHNAFTSFNVCFKDTLTGLGLKNVVLRNLYPFDDQLPVSCDDEK